MTTATTATPTLEQLLAGARPVTDGRRESLALALDLGADHQALVSLRDAMRVSRNERIRLPLRYGGCSRASGWARLGTGEGAVWGDTSAETYAVVHHPGKWTTHSSDGFRRQERMTWVVHHVQVGVQTWTIAS